MFDSIAYNHYKKYLLLTSSGTGKTYASAFAVREQSPRKMLFLVHREQIAKQPGKMMRRMERYVRENTL